MSDTHIKLQYGNDYADAGKYWTSFNYFSFSIPNTNPNPTHLPKH